MKCGVRRCSLSGYHVSCSAENAQVDRISHVRPDHLITFCAMSTRSSVCANSSSILSMLSDRNLRSPILSDRRLHLLVLVSGKSCCYTVTASQIYQLSIEI